MKSDVPGIISVERIGSHTYRSTLIFGAGDVEDDKICNFTLAAEEEVFNGSFDLFHKEERILSAALDAISSRLEEIRRAQEANKKVLAGNKRARAQTIDLTPPTSDDNA
ncbi:hypothetical protein [Acetobacter oryzoeni]|uniref:hypothetical protein n=1 Tax=Acetobacter oryzoeni TaxID=2500548 RepID=UPI003DA869FF